MPDETVTPDEQLTATPQIKPDEEVVPELADEHPISYQALAEGTPVFSSAGAEVGRVQEVLYDSSLDVFDGIVVSTGAGDRFVDRDSVVSITTRAVRTSLTAEQAAHLSQPDGAPVYTVKNDGGDGGAAPGILA